MKEAGTMEKNIVKLNDELLDNVSGGVSFFELDAETQSKVMAGICPKCNQLRMKRLDGPGYSYICMSCGFTC